MMAPRDPAPVTPLPIESRARLRLRSLGWALLAAALAAAINLPLALLDPATTGGAVFLLDALLRSAGCGFFYGLLAFHLQRVDPDDGHLQAGLVGAVCGIHSLGLPPLMRWPLEAPLSQSLARVAPAVMMELVRAWLPLIGAALVLHGSQALSRSLATGQRPISRP
jgi:hypothetical protein